MAKVCEITGARVRRGSRIHRSGLAKKKGGIGRHVTKVVKRDVSPNLRKKRIWVPELNKYVKEEHMFCATERTNSRHNIDIMRKINSFHKSLHFTKHLLGSHCV